jgi:hypothetical protein
MEISRIFSSERLTVGLLGRDGDWAKAGQTSENQKLKSKSHPSIELNI